MGIPTTCKLCAGVAMVFMVILAVFTRYPEKASYLGRLYHGNKPNTINGISRFSENKVSSGILRPSRVIQRHCTEHRHVAFLKVHKAGSTTIMNILQRFGEKRRLICAIPKERLGNYLGYGTTIQRQHLLRPPKGKSYNLLFNHVVYSREAFRAVMPASTKYIAIVREPLDLLDSAIRYLSHRTPYIVRIPEDKLTNFLSSPKKYETNSTTSSFTNNRMAFDFGLAPILLHNKEAILSYLRNITQDFNLVLIFEYFDESLILMKRLFCWTFEDIVYVPLNINRKRQKRAYSQELRRNHSKWAVADIAFYDFFLERFWTIVGEQSDDFFREVKEFKRVLQYVQSFCAAGDSKLIVENSEFNEEFVVFSNSCTLMMMAELDFMELTWKRHLSDL